MICPSATRTPPASRASADAFDTPYWSRTACVPEVTIPPKRALMRNENERFFHVKLLRQPMVKSGVVCPILRW